jgi:hypothetical protein
VSAKSIGRIALSAVGRPQDAKSAPPPFSALLGKADSWSLGGKLDIVVSTSASFAPRRRRGQRDPLSTNRRAAFVNWFRGLDWGSACGGPSSFLSSWRSQSLKHPTLKSGQPNIQRQRHSLVSLAHCARDSAARWRAPTPARAGSPAGNAPQDERGRFTNQHGATREPSGRTCNTRGRKT